MNSISRDLAGSLQSEPGNVKHTGNTFSVLHFPHGENMFPLLTPCRETSVSSLHPHHFERCLSQSSSGYWLFTYCPSTPRSTFPLLNGASIKAWDINLQTCSLKTEFQSVFFHFRERKWKDSECEFYFYFLLHKSFFFWFFLELIIMNVPSMCSRTNYSTVMQMSSSIFRVLWAYCWSQTIYSLLYLSSRLRGN